MTEAAAPGAITERRGNVLIITINRPEARNAVNASVSIDYFTGNKGMVEIQVYNMMGQLVRTLVHGYHEPGGYSIIWNGQDESSREVTPGIYLLKMNNAGNFSVNTIVKAPGQPHTVF